MNIERMQKKWLKDGLETLSHSLRISWTSHTNLGIVHLENPRDPKCPLAWKRKTWAGQYGIKKALVRLVRISNSTNEILYNERYNEYQRHRAGGKALSFLQIRNFETPRSEFTSCADWKFVTERVAKPRLRPIVVRTPEKTKHWQYCTAVPDWAHKSRKW